MWHLIIQVSYNVSFTSFNSSLIFKLHENAGKLATCEHARIWYETFRHLSMICVR